MTETPEALAETIARLELMRVNYNKLCRAQASTMADLCNSTNLLSQREAELRDEQKKCSSIQAKLDELTEKYNYTVRMLETTSAVGKRGEKETKSNEISSPVEIKVFEQALQIVELKNKLREERQSNEDIKYELADAEQICYQFEENIKKKNAKIEKLHTRNSQLAEKNAKIIKKFYDGCVEMLSEHNEILELDSVPEVDPSDQL